MTTPRLVALDLDGTLLDDQKRVSGRNVRALQVLLSRGVSIALASARDCSSIHRVVPIAHPALYYIASGGALIYAPSFGEVLRADYLPPELVDESLVFFQQTGYPVFFNDMNSYWVDQLNDRVKMIEQRYLLESSLISDARDIKRVMRVSLAAPIGILRQVAARAEQIFEKQLTVSLASPDWLDLLPVGAGKGALLEILQNGLGVVAEQTMAIGDFESDLSLFAHAKICIAMGNAEPIVKKSATDITGTNNQDGVAAALEKYFSLPAPEGSSL